MRVNSRRNATAALAAAALGAAILFRFPPAQYGFYPQCPIHALLGIDCPGCGATRALAALLHGHLAEAFHFNALFVLMLPFALVFAAESLRRAFTQSEFRWPQPSPRTMYALCALAAIFTVARNVI